MTRLVILALLVALSAPVSAGEGSPIRVGGVFPLRGSAADLAGDELGGVEIARDLVNADGGVAGRPLELVVRDLERNDMAQEVVDDLRAAGIDLVIGSYSSDLSIAVSAAASGDGLVYWEAGAVADRLTGRGLPGVFRVGASGATLGSSSARFIAEQLASRLGSTPAQLRVALVAADDDYARSVADAAAAGSHDAGMQLVLRRDYQLLRPDWPGIMADLAAAAPDVIILASHIPDGVQFRQAMLAANLKVGAFVGSTMAQCGPEWGQLLGADAIGTFASDRPPGSFDPDALSADARATFDRFAAEWGVRHGGAPTEEGLSGFAAAWPLFHDVLPAAAASGSLEPAGIVASAQALDLPRGALPNGAGIRFSQDEADRGQNLRAAAVVWQWQALNHSETVWPATYATGQIAFVPLPR
jgi:branched-chain amino acid transport system substrate-binding protein